MPRTALRMVSSETPADRPEQFEQQPTTVHILRQFGKRLAKRREELNMTQAAMMNQLNHVSGSNFGRTAASVWENGRAPPDIVVVYYLAKVLKTRAEYLAYGVKMLRSPLSAQARSAVIGEPIIPRTARIKPMRKLQRQVMVRRAWRS